MSFRVEMYNKCTVEVFVRRFYNLLTANMNSYRSSVREVCETTCSFYTKTGNTLSYYVIHLLDAEIRYVDDLQKF